jgi:hypothetical protein
MLGVRQVFNLSDLMVGVMAAASAIFVVVWQGRKTRRSTKDELDTGNGHTAGESLSRIETQLWNHENRLDSIDVRLSEGQNTFDEIEEKLVQHEFETRPVRDWVTEQMEKKEEQDG